MTRYNQSQKERKRAMQTSFPTSEVWKMIHRCDWSINKFSLDKAYLAALLSELAYLRIAEFELEGASRVNVIPCAQHRKMTESRDVTFFDRIFREMDIGESFILERRYVIVMGIKTRNVIFISMRGTKYLYDWVVNFRSKRIPYSVRNGNAYFHYGFFKAISACFSQIDEELERLSRHGEEPLPVYLTGHSLGGALAAIMNAVRGRVLGRGLVQEGILEHRVPFDACYTFGMPRYGDAQAVSRLAQPFMFYNELDVVPSVPPTWLGYESGTSEYMLDGRSIERAPSNDTLSFAAFLTLLATGIGIKHHDIELYRQRLALNVN